MQKVGIFGGSFDPIHIGHLRIAIESMGQLALDQVIFEVADRSPLKETATVAHLENRRRYVSLAIADQPKFSLGNFETAAKSPNYTVDTLRHYAAQGYKLHLILGSDQLSSFSEWREPEQIMRLARLAVVRRGAVSVARALRDVPPAWATKIDRVLMKRLDISSTIIRAKLAARQSVMHLVPRAVLEAITFGRDYE